MSEIIISWGFPMLMGIILLLTGLLSLKFPPKKINGGYGYRTKNAMKSQEHWDLAQRQASNLLVKYGVVLLGVGPLFYLLHVEGLQATIGGAVIMFTLMVLVIIKTERALKKAFDD